MKNFLKLISINFLILIGLLSVLEIIAKGFNIFLEKSAKESQWMNINLDPAVGLSHDIRDFEYFYKDNKDGNNNSRLYTKKSYGSGKKHLSIHVFGGSTTDPLGFHYSGVNGNWPEHFGNYLVNNNKNIKLNLYNYGVAGAQSSQELFRLISSLKHNIPDIFISYSGLNEVFYENNLYQNKDNIYAPLIIITDLNGSILDLPNGRYFKCNFLCFESTNLYRFFGEGINKFRTNLRFSWRKKGIRPIDNIGFSQAKILYIDNKNFIKNLETKKILTEEQKIILDKAVEIWADNVIIMNSIVQNLNKKYYVFIQPIYGLGLSRNQIIKDSKIIGKKNLYYNLSLSSIIDESFEKNNYLFDKLIQKCNTLSFCVDATKIKPLTNNLNLYDFDSTHPNSKGNNIIGKFIADKITDECIINICYE